LETKEKDLYNANAKRSRSLLSVALSLWNFDFLLFGSSHYARTHLFNNLCLLLCKIHKTDNRSKEIETKARRSLQQLLCRFSCVSAMCDCFCF